MTRLAGFGHDLGFAGVLLGVQHFVRQLGLFQEARQQLGVFDAGRTHQHRLATLMAVADVFEDRVVLFRIGLEDLIVLVLADHRLVGRDDDRFKPVDFLELVRFRIGRAGHAGQLFVHAEVVLERDGCQRLVFVLDLHAFLGFDGLVQAIGPAAAHHQAAREFVDDHHLAVLHDVLLVAEEQVVGAQGHHQVVHQRDMARVVQRLAFGQDAQASQDRFGVLVSGFGQVDLLALFVDPVVAFGFRLLRLGFAGHALEQRRHRVHADVELGVIFGLAGNDQRRAGFVDQDRVHFVDDGVEQHALAAVLNTEFHVVAQVVETEFVIGAVSDVGGVGGLLLFVRLLRHHHARGHAQEVVQAPHPFRVAAGKIVVHRNNVHALAGASVQVNGQRRHQRLAFPRAHFGNLAIVQRDAAQQLRVEVPHPEHALARFAHNGEGFRQQVVQRRALRVSRSEFVSLGRQLRIGKRGNLGLQPIDLGYQLAILLKQPVVAATYEFFEQRNHAYVGRTSHAAPAKGKGSASRDFDVIG
ncbi:hypothetical protein D3C72_453040 [compost metagenome]